MLSTSIEAPDTLHTTLKTAPTMKAVRWHGPGDIRLDEIEEPVCGKGQVKVGILSMRSSTATNGILQMRPAYVGICGSGMSKLSLPLQTIS